MSLKRLSFSIVKEVTNPGEDSRSFLFLFSIVDAHLVGSPEETQSTTEHRLIVTAAINRLLSWHLKDSDLVKVLFKIGQKKIVEKVKTGTLARQERVMVHTESHTNVCPYDPSRLQEPYGIILEIDEEKKIGFK